MSHIFVFFVYIYYYCYHPTALTYSIAYGLLAGIACWIFLQSVFKLLQLVGIERPVFEEQAPVDFSTKKDKEASSEEDADKPASAEEETPAAAAEGEA